MFSESSQRRAIFESGPYSGWSSINMTASETHYNAMVQQLECQSGGDGAAQIACLRSKSAGQEEERRGRGERAERGEGRGERGEERGEREERMRS